MLFKQSVSLVVSGVEWKPHLDFVKAPDGHLTVQGPVANLLNMVAASLNFTYSLVTPEDQAWGRKLPDGNWTGMVGQVFRQEADIALGPFAQSEERRQAVDYTQSFFFDGRTIIAGKGRPEIDPWSFMLPLQPPVWVALLVGLVVAWLSLVVMGHNPKDSSQLTSASHFMRTSHLLFQHLRIILRQDVSMNMTRGREMVLMGGGVGGGDVGTLVSLLAVRHVPQPLQTIRDVLDATHITVVLEGANTIVPVTLAKIKTGELKELNDLKYFGRIKYKTPALFKKEVEPLVRRGDHVQIENTLTINSHIDSGFATTRRCDFYKGRQTFFITQHCLIGQKGNPIVAALSRRIRSVVEAGLYPYWLDKSLPAYHNCRHSPSKITVREPLALDSFWISRKKVLKSQHDGRCLQHKFCLGKCDQQRVNVGEVKGVRLIPEVVNMVKITESRTRTKMCKSKPTFTEYFHGVLEILGRQHCIIILS
ncbi:Glutamate receptor-like 3 [Homarus americanus]|uniref:Glutamate receptor-like 3 n=1 Tax=Homarus americanus TaxID=6706 RepID=A0A8J5JW27_HOMAM|nr:Glutamate receptor-like 3 [Homarus americanus]